MTATRLYQQAALGVFFGSAPAISAGIPSINELARINERAALSGARPRLYYGRVMLDPNRVGHNAGLVSGEIIYPLTRLTGALVTVTLDIAAEIPDGIPDSLVHQVIENGRKLKFNIQGFAQE